LDTTSVIDDWLCCRIIFTLAIGLSIRLRTCPYATADPKIEMTFRNSLLLIVSLLASSKSFAQMTPIDFRYAPEYWYSAIGFPFDHHKTLADDHGALLFDFGPGPYVTPKTKISFVPPEGAQRKQSYRDPRVPILQTTYEREDESRVSVLSYSLPPTKRTPDLDYALTRINGLTGTLSWASPPDGYDPAFRNVAWGTNRPIEFRLAVPSGARKQIAFGFCESYRDKPGMRKIVVEVEGSSPIELDPLDGGERNLPMVVIADAVDTDGDGIIPITILSPEGDPNTILNVLWVFESTYEIDEIELLAGRLSDKAEIYLDAGREPQVLARPSRFDVLRLTTDSPRNSVLRIETNRNVEVREGAVFTDGFAFALSRPLPSSWEKTDRGIDLHYGNGARSIEVVVQNGFADDVGAFPTSVQTNDFDRIADYWLTESTIPYFTISVPDVALQELLDASIRTVYQFTENVDGILQAQPGAALYRGQWMHDGVYFADLFAQLGDASTARRLVDRLLSFQKPTGQAVIMRPNLIHRETPLLIWLLCRYAELTNDDAWLSDNWEHVQKGVDWIEGLRNQTLVPNAANYGLTPSGFADGGIHGVQPEYASVNWVLIALPNAIRAAKRLGYSDDANAWEKLNSAFLESFWTAASRDIRTDEHGNEFLPIRVGDSGPNEIPQQAQWMVPEALVYGEHIATDHSLASGTIRILELHQSQGLVTSTGWLKDGIWVYFGGFLAEANLRMGEGRRAGELLYAMANHASPVFTWPEEQMPVGQGRRTAGDFPHGWASSTMPRLVIRLLVFEDGNDLTLFRGIPVEWLSPGKSTSLHHVATRFGKVDVNIDVSDAGNTVEIRVSPLHPRSDSELRIDWRQFEEAGFTVRDAMQSIEWGQEFRATLHR
jgi:hypothetical protein